MNNMSLNKCNNSSNL